MYWRIAILLYRRVTFLIFIRVDEFGGSPSNLHQKGWNFWASPAWPNNPFRRHLASENWKHFQFFRPEKKDENLVAKGNPMNLFFCFASKLNLREVDVLTTKSSERKTSSYIESLLSTGSINTYNDMTINCWTISPLEVLFGRSSWNFRKSSIYSTNPPTTPIKKARRFFFLHHVSQIAADDYGLMDPFGDRLGSLVQNRDAESPKLGGKCHSPCGTFPPMGRLQPGGHEISTPPSSQQIEWDQICCLSAETQKAFTTVLAGCGLTFTSLGFGPVSFTR